ncbi:MAG: sirohydrochlorin chelatase [Myxococcota bacterium]
MGHGPTALLIAAHGSRAPGWAQRVREFAEHVGESAAGTAIFSAIEAAFLESSTPSVPDAVRSLLERGASRVLVAPLLLTMSTHLKEDLPGLLGLDVAEHVRRRLRGEGQHPLESGLPVTLLSLGALEEILAANVARRLSLRCDGVTPAEGIVLCAYGSTLHHGRWKSLLKRTQVLLKQRGFGPIEHAFVGHVVSKSPEPTRQAILRVGRVHGVERVHVVPLLLGVTALQTHVIAAACQQAKQDIGGTAIVYEPDAVLPDGDLAARVAGTALREVGVYGMGGPGGRA